MKKINTVCFVALALLCACSQVSLPEETRDVLVKKTFTISSVQSRSVLDGLDVLWDGEEGISVFDCRGNRFFGSTSEGTEAVFSGSVVKSDSYALLYPYDESASASGTDISATVPVSQRATVGSFADGANLSVAVIEDGQESAVMKNAVSLIAFTLPESSYDILEVRIESQSGDCLSGPVSIDASSGDPFLQPVTGAVDYVTLTSSEYIKPGEYYLSAIPGEHASGLRVKVLLYGDQYLYKNYEASAQLVRNEILDFGLLDFEDFTFAESEVSDGTSDPVSAYADYGVDYSKIPDMRHPYLLISEEEFAELRRRVVEVCSEDDDLYLYHKEIMKRAAKVARKTDELVYYIDENGNILDIANEALERLISAAYCYKITGEDSYLQKARFDLATVCAFPVWTPDMMSVAEISTGVAIAYDWLYNELTTEERAAIETALYEKCLVPFMNYSIRVDSNWNQSTCGGAILASAAVYNKFKATAGKTIDRCIKHNKRAVENIFYPWGCGKEGPGYTDYTINFQGIILQVLKNMFGTCCGIDEIEGLEKTGEWYTYIMGPVATFNFSDASAETFSSSMAAVFLASFYDRPDLLLRERAVLRLNETYSSSRFLPIAAIWLFKNPFTRTDATYPQEHVWSCQGASPMVLVRNGWNYDETDSYVGLKAAAGYSSHSHLDGGSFVYDAHGYRWSSDIRMGKYAGYKNDIKALDGSSLFTYKTQESLRWDILCLNNYYHSTLSFTWSDGSVAKRHVTDQITYKPCSVVETYQTGENGYGGKIDITDHYSDAASAVYRSVRLDGQDLLVTDEITSQAGHDAPFEWRMVTTADVVVENDCIRLTHGDKTVYLYCETSGDVSQQPEYGVEQEIVRPESWEPRAWDSYQSYEGFHVVKFSASVAAGQKTGVFRTYLKSERP